MSYSFTLAAQKSTTDVPMCSHWEATQGLSVDYSVTSGINLYALKMKDWLCICQVKDAHGRPDSESCRCVKVVQGAR